MSLSPLRPRARLVPRLRRRDDRARRPRGAVGARAADRHHRSALARQRRRCSRSAAASSTPARAARCRSRSAPAAWPSSRPPGWPETGPTPPFLPRAPAPDGCYHSRPADLLVGPFLRMKTYNAKPGEIQRDWYLVDAEGKTLGRLATQIAEQPARQAQAGLHAARRHRRLRRRRQRREDRGHGQQARGEDVLPALRLSRRPARAHAARAARPAADRGAAQGGQGHAPPQQARPRPIDQAQDLRRPGASARGAGTDHSGGVRCRPRPSISAPASARRPSRA